MIFGDETNSIIFSAPKTWGLLGMKIMLLIISVLKIMLGIFLVTLNPKKLTMRNVCLFVALHPTSSSLTHT